MNSVLNIINYYIEHKNTNDNVLDYIKCKLDELSLNELIIIQIKLIFKNSTDNLANKLVVFITNKINELLKVIDIYDLISVIDSLNYEKSNTKDEIEIKAIDIWIVNLNNSFNTKVDKIDIKELLMSYTKSVSMINESTLVNEYISILSKKIDKILLKSDLLNTITNIMPELNALYKENAREKNSLYKLLDFYIDLIENKIKSKIKELVYEERLILKEKINLICKDILENDDPNDDFKVLVINNYLRYI